MFACGGTFDSADLGYYTSIFFFHLGRVMLFYGSGQSPCLLIDITASVPTRLFGGRQKCAFAFHAVLLMGIRGAQCNKVAMLDQGRGLGKVGRHMKIDRSDD
jgi:hypothetical protein